VNRVPTGGEVKAAVTLGRGGEVVAIRIVSTNSALSTEVEHSPAEKGGV